MISGKFGEESHNTESFLPFLLNLKKEKRTKIYEWFYLRRSTEKLEIYFVTSRYLFILCSIFSIFIFIRFIHVDISIEAFIPFKDINLAISSLNNTSDNEMPSNGPLILFSHCRLLLPGVRLSPDIVFITPDDSFTAERRTCHLLGKARLLCPEVSIYFLMCFRERSCWDFWSQICRNI